MPPRLQIDFGRTFPVERFIDFDIAELVDISCATAATSGASQLIFYELWRYYIIVAVTKQA